MTDAQRLDLHRLFLVGLRAIGASGRTAAQLTRDARSELAIEIDEARVLGELRQLSDQKLVAVLNVPLAAPRWILTERGAQTLAAAGL